MTRWQAAEEAIYARSDDPLTNWDAPELLAAVESAGLAAQMQTEENVTDMQITASVIARWFTPAKDGRPSYADHLAAQLSQEEIAAVRSVCEQQLLGQTVPWRGLTAYIVAWKLTPPGGVTSVTLCVQGQQDNHAAAQASACAMAMPPQTRDKRRVS